MISRDSAVLPLVPNEDHSDKEGYAVKASSGKAALCDAVTDIPLGVLVDGKPTTGRSSVAIAAGNPPPVKVKLSATPGTVALGTFLTVCADGSAQADAGSGNRVRFARALEAGSANELIEAALINPVSLS